jgi:SAM-dependent methyltransferase
MLEIAASRCNQLDNLHLFHWDITQPFPVDNWKLADVVTLFSVLPYVREWPRFFCELRRIMKPGGIFLASFPNQLFDLYSQNSFTAEFILTELVDPLVEADIYDHVSMHLKRRLHKPATFQKDSAYLNRGLFFKRANPLTIGAELAIFGVQVERIFYMNNHPVPPGCLNGDVGSTEMLRAQRELNLDYEHWTQMFTNSTFLVAGKF